MMNQGEKHIFYGDTYETVFTVEFDMNLRENDMICENCNTDYLLDRLRGMGWL